MSKKVLIEGSLIFNENPKKGLAFLQGMAALRSVNDVFTFKENSFLPSPADPASIANLLVKNTFLDKKKLGIYLAHPSNQEVLAEFVGKLGFKGVRVSPV